MADKNPETQKKEWRQKLNRAKTQLEQMHQYKQILREEGLVADAEDKAKESRLVLLIRQLEKKLGGQWVPDDEYRGPKPKRPPFRGKARTKPLSQA